MMGDKTQEEIYMDQVNDYRAKQLSLCECDTSVAAKRWRKLSPNTTKDYISAYRKLRDTLGDDLIACCHDIDDNTTKLKAKGFTDSRIRNLYSAYINLMYANDICSQVCDEYKKYLKNYQESYQESQKSNELTSPSQIENMITYSELLDYIKKLRNRRLIFPGQSVDDVLLILEISKTLPYRINEFANMKYIDNKEFVLLFDDEKNKYNWLVKKGWDYFFHFRQYETTKSRPTEIQNIDKPLAKIIRAHIKDRKGVMTAWGYHLFHYTPEQLSKLMIKVSKEVIGKNVGSAILRKVVVSHYYQTTKEKTQEQETFAHAIGHSQSIQNLIYNKNIGE